MIRAYRFDTVTTMGADGAAAGSAASKHPIAGKILALHVDYSAGQNINADVVIATSGVPSMPILTRSNSAADGWFFPRAAACNIAAEPLTFDGTHPVVEPIPVNDYVTVSVSGGDNGETVGVMLVYED